MQQIQKTSTITDFEFLNKLGKGSFGTVYKVRRKIDKTIYVMKQINISQLNSAFKTSALNEVKILSSLENPYIVKYYDSFVEKNLLNIVMEYCEGGDLANYIRGQLGRPLPENKIWKFLIQMCMGLSYIHGKKILHRDIKSMNIFLTKEEEIRIGDLGVAKAMAETANFAHTMVGTPYYLSPEMCEEKPYNEKSDIWALGCVLYEMCTQKHPFEANNQAALLLKILRGKFNPISNGYSPDLAEIVELCLCKDYRKRPTASELLNRPSTINKAKAFNISLSAETRLLTEAQKASNRNLPIQESANNEKPQEAQIKDNKASAPERGNVKVNAANGANPAKNEPPKAGGKEMNRPSADLQKGINDAKALNMKKPNDLANNNLFKIHTENKNANAAVNAKDKPPKAPLGKKDPGAVVPAGKVKEAVNKAKDIKSNDNPAKAKIMEKPQKLNSVESQQKLVGRIKADSPVISRPKLLEEKEKPPIVFKEQGLGHKKHSSVDVKATEEELNQVKNLPDVVVPTPRKKQSKDKISALFGKNIDFFAPSTKPNIPKGNVQYNMPQKVVLDNAKSTIPKQQIVDDEFIENEFPTNDKIPSSKPSAKESTGRNTSTEEHESPSKDGDIPVTEVDKDVGLFEVTDAAEDGDDEEASEDEAYDETHSQSEGNNSQAEAEEEETKKESDRFTSEEENDEQINKEASQKEEEKENIQSRLEQALKKKENIEQLIKERTKNFITRWGQKAFDELSVFFRKKIGDENTDKTEAEIEDFLGEKLKGEVQPEQVFFIVSKILPLEYNLDKIDGSIKKYTEELK